MKNKCVNNLFSDKYIEIIYSTFFFIRLDNQWIINYKSYLMSNAL